MKNSLEDPAGWFGKILRILAKLGILRYGVKRAAYTSGRDRPAELLMPDVFDAERDLTTTGDVKALLGRPAPPEKPKP